MMTFLRALTDAQGEVYEVGGVVRDRLMGRPRNDADYLVRKLKVEQIAAILKSFGKVTLVGQSFGVVKFSPHQNPDTTIDIALPRKEFSTGQGHRDFSVSFDPLMPLNDDLGRRDFTINAMARNVVTGEMVDPFGGKKDLEEKKLRMVFPKAFEEDPLRLLRAVQFAARLGFIIDTETLTAMRAASPLISTVSAERTIQELGKLLLAPRPSVGFRLMAETGLLKIVIPELAALIGISQDKRPGDDVFDHTMRVVDAAASDKALQNPGEINLMVAALLHDVGKATTARYHPPSKRVVFFGHQMVSARMAKKFFARMKIETIGVDREKVLTLIENHMFETKAYFTDRAIRRFVARVGKDVIFTLLDLRLADNRGGKHPSGIKGVERLKTRVHKELSRKPPFGPKDLAVNGHDLIALGIPAGPQLGQAIRALVEVVLDHPEFNTKEHLLSLTEEMRRHGIPMKEKTDEEKGDGDNGQINS